VVGEVQEVSTGKESEIDPSTDPQRPNSRSASPRSQQSGAPMPSETVKETVTEVGYVDSDTGEQSKMCCPTSTERSQIFPGALRASQVSMRDFRGILVG
jgi:hypothetical protein